MVPGEIELGFFSKVDARCQEERESGHDDERRLCDER